MTVKIVANLPDGELTWDSLLFKSYAKLGRFLEVTYDNAPAITSFVVTIVL